MSHSSQTSSVLDQVYNISLQEESVRQELSVVDQKILQLQKLIEEATQQMNKFTDKKDTVNILFSWDKQLIDLSYQEPENTAATAGRSSNATNEQIY